MNDTKTHILKSEICKMLAEKTPDLDKDQAKLIVDNLIKFMSQQLLEFNRIEIRGFGILSLRPIYKNKVRNPRYDITVNEPMVSWTIHFKPGKKLAFRVRGNDKDETFNI